MSDIRYRLAFATTKYSGSGEQWIKDHVPGAHHIEIAGQELFFFLAPRLPEPLPDGVREADTP